MPQEQRRTVAAVGVSLTALLLAAPRPQDALRALLDVSAAADPTTPVVAVVALTAWAVAGWLALTVLLVLLSRLPGALGRAVGGLARRTAPMAVRRAVEAALGLTVAVGVLAPSTALAAPVTGPPAVTSADRGWDLDWPDVLSTPDPAATTPAPSRPAPSASSTTTAPVPARPTALPTVRQVEPAVRRRPPTSRPVSPTASPPAPCDPRLP